MCDCISTINADLAKRNTNTKLVVPMFGPKAVLVETMKADEKNRKKPLSCLATFCPFCGEKYPAAVDNPPEAASPQRDGEKG
jgi:hypothetical protein